MHTYNFFGKEIKRNKELIESIFTKLTDNVMTFGTLLLLHDLNKITNRLLIDIKPTIGDYYLLPLIFHNLTTDVYEEDSTVYNDVNKNIELNNCNDKVNTCNFEISDTKRLDDLYETTDKNISYLKIDSNERELILKGAKNIILNHKPIIQMKWIYQTFNDCKNMINIIREYNYTPLMIIGQDLFIVPTEKINDYRYLERPLHHSVKNNRIFNWINNF